MAGAVLGELGAGAPRPVTVHRAGNGAETLLQKQQCLPQNDFQGLLLQSGLFFKSCTQHMGIGIYVLVLRRAILLQIYVLRALCAHGGRQEYLVEFALTPGKTHKWE